MTMPALPRVLRIPSVLLLAGLLALLLDPASARAEKMLPDTELSGSAYRSFELIAPVPDFCRKVCEKDTGCQAWMFSWPGKKGKRAKCFLYSAVEGKREDTCCIAGYKSKGSSFGETIARWFGGEEEQGKPQAGAGADGKEPARSLPEMPVPVARKQPPLADPADVERKRQFCADYADKAIAANRKARDLGCGFRGGLWGASRRGYFNWCMKNPEQRAERNMQRRAEALQRCERTLAARPAEPPVPPAPDMAPEPPLPNYPPYARPAPTSPGRNLWRRARFSYSWLKRSGPGPRATPWRPTLSGKCVLVRACECPQGNTCRVYDPGSIAIAWPAGCDGPPAYYVCRVRRR